MEIQNPNGTIIIAQSTEGNEKISVDVSGLADGVYFVKLKGKSIKVIKFVKQ